MSLSMNQKFTPFRLLQFALPSIVMMMFMSCYTIVDGMFVSRFVGSSALSSVNIVYPVIGVVIAVATMIATGGNAIISKSLGEGRKKEAREYLTQFVVMGVGISIVLMVVTLLLLTPLSKLLGANEQLLRDCETYLKIMMCFAPACMLQTLFQSYLVTAGKPVMGLVLMIGAGILNGVLDYVFIVIFQMGVAGAALATGIGQALPAIVGVLFFLFSRKDLYFTPFRFDFKVIGKACFNGSSEMVVQLSNSVVTFLFNVILMRLVGEHGVAAITILLYGQFLFNAFYTGLSIGVGPIIGFLYGAKEKKNLKSCYKTVMIFTCVSSIIIMGAAVTFSKPLVRIFTQDEQTLQFALSGFTIFAINFLFSGFNIVSSGIFTALSNGKVSAIISFARTLVFLVICLLVLPPLFGIVGVWVAVPIAEGLTLLVSIYMHQRYLIRNQFFA